MCVRYLVYFPSPDTRRRSSLHVCVKRRYRRFKRPAQRTTTCRSWLGPVPARWSRTIRSRISRLNWLWRYHPVIHLAWSTSRVARELASNWINGDFGWCSLPRFSCIRYRISTSEGIFLQKTITQGGGVNISSIYYAIFSKLFVYIFPLFPSFCERSPVQISCGNALIR